LALNIISAIKIGILARKIKADFIYSNTLAIPAGALAAKLFRFKHIWHIHEFGREDHNLIFDWGEKISYFVMNKTSDICLVNSQAVCEKFKKIIDPSKLRVVYYSVSIPDWLKNPSRPEFRQEGCNCLIIGQLQEGKRQEEAVRAVGELKKMGIKARLSIAGEGDVDYKKRLLIIIKKKKLNQSINFLGYNPNPLEFYQKADIVLVCSRAEAFGRVTIEAMKTGKPVIGADAGGTSELIKDGFNGLLYKPGDYKELALKIKYLLDNPNLRQRMGLNAQNWAMKKFSSANYGSDVYKILKKALRKNSLN
jgi:glycosyltransferase involved in cell wall biosynthesis